MLGSDGRTSGSPVRRSLPGINCLPQKVMTGSRVSLNFELGSFISAKMVLDNVRSPPSMFTSVNCTKRCSAPQLVLSQYPVQVVDRFGLQIWMQPQR